MNRLSPLCDLGNPSAISPGRSRLRALLAAKEFALTAEITPPASSNLADLLAKAAPLKGMADAVNVTDGAGARAHLDSIVAASALLKEGIEPILQLTCRDRNRIALQSQLLGAAALGITNLLLLKGDDPRAGDQPDAKPVFDLDTAALAATAVAIRDRGELPYGRKVGGSAAFFVGVADAPMDPPPGWMPASMQN
jgi:methylenetetrahydrofolate reductase (NADPH)